MNKIESDEKQNQLRKRIEELIELKGGGHNPDLVADIIENALKMLNDVEHRGDARIIQTAVRELRYSFKLFAPYADKRKVAVFGSARTEPERKVYIQAVEFGRLASQAGFMVITGAGGGIMQAAHEGAGPEMSFGANIRLPWEQAPNPVIQKDKKLITFKYFFTRKLTFIRHADAIVLFPGGFGTMDEGYEALTLMQTGKSKLMPLVLLDQPNGTFWKTWDKHTKEHLLRNKYISEEDLNLYQITDNPEQAIKIISKFYRNYHSSRFVKELFVIRILHKPTEYAIEALNEDFSDIIVDGKIKLIEPTPEELEDNDFPDLPRIAFKFNRKNYGRLRQLIDRINTI